MELPKLPTKGANRWALSFHPTLGYESPKIEVRGGSSSSSSEWRSAAIATEVDWDWVQARFVAARNPVSLGTAFKSEFVDTWVPHANPEEQTVTWHFTDPLGRETELRGSYEGHFRWRVSFYPEILGRWSYYLDHNLNWPPYRSEQVFFDVLGDDLTVVSDHLEKLAQRIEGSELTTPHARFEAFGDEFLRLERAGIQILTPETFRSELGVKFSSRVDEIRRELGEALPEQPSAFGRTTQSFIKQDIARELYRLFGIRLYKH